MTASPIRACSADGSQQYTLGPAAVIGSHVVTVAVGEVPYVGGATVDVKLDPAGSAALAAVTRELFVKSPPQSQLAYYVLGEVFGVGTVTEPLDVSLAQLQGLNTSEAQRMVSRLKGG